MMQIRPVNPDQDVAVIQSLYAAFYTAPLPNVPHLLTTHTVRVVQAVDNQVVGFYAISPASFMWLAVIPDQRQRGIGRLLMDDALEQARQSGTKALISRINDTSVAGQAFCERFEFKPYLHMVNLELDLKTWDDARFVSALHTATANGIEFRTFADYGDTLANRQRLYDLNKALSATIPRAEPQVFVDFATYVETRLLPATSPHSGIYLALDGDQWIGMQQISLHDGYAFNEMTGVLPDYRGYGVAQALKILTAQFAKRHQQSFIRTFNDVSNAPMIAVNEKLGFRQGKRFYQVRRKLI
jgi:GNAT superfamily N-acetyltransferase